MANKTCPLFKAALLGNSNLKREYIDSDDFYFACECTKEECAMWTPRECGYIGWSNSDLTGAVHLVAETLEKMRSK